MSALTERQLLVEQALSGDTPANENIVESVELLSAYVGHLARKLDDLQTEFAVVLSKPLLSPVLLVQGLVVLTHIFCGADG